MLLLLLLQALDERRLSLVLDQWGIIRKAGNSPTTLFGFNPAILLGKSIHSIVDVFMDEQANGEGGRVSALAVRVGPVCRRCQGAG